MNNFGKNLALWIIIGLLLVALFNLFQSSSTRSPQASVPYSEFIADVEAGQIADVTIKGNQVTGHYTDGRSFSTSEICARSPDASFTPTTVGTSSASRTVVSASMLKQVRPGTL